MIVYNNGVSMKPGSIVAVKTARKTDHVYLLVDDDIYQDGTICPETQTYTGL